MQPRLRTLIALTLLALAGALPGVFSMPPLDRDEARFAQASAQMMETGDYVRINLQDEPRHKKPVGIHWLQVAAVTLVSDVEDRAIWAYRLPSVLGALIAVWATYWAGCILVGRNAAFAGAALLSVGLLIGGEAGIAKTDAMLLACTTLAMAALARLYEGGGKGSGLLFWVAVALGVLIKGPITPMIAGLAIVALIALDRRVRWLSPLLWWAGPLAAALIVAPWVAAVQIATDGAFLTEALGGDLGPKLNSGHEGHGAPFGLHAGLLPLLIWPGTLFLIPGVVLAVRAVFRPFDDHEAGALRFLLAWTLPAWLVFEITPTKLVHYTLPLYPALALMAGAAVQALAEKRTSVTAQVVSTAVFAAIGALLTTLILILPDLNAMALAGREIEQDALTEALRGLSDLERIAIMAIAGTLAVLPLMLWRAPRAQVLMACALGIATNFVVFERIGPNLNGLLVTERVSTALEAQALHPRLTTSANPPLVTLGIREPSLVFLTATDTVLAENAEQAAAIFTEGPGRAAVVDARFEDEFLNAVAARGAPQPIRFGEAAGDAMNPDPIRGLNYSNGDIVELVIFRSLGAGRFREARLNDAGARPQ